MYKNDYKKNWGTKSQHLYKRLRRNGKKLSWVVLELKKKIDISRESFEDFATVLDSKGRKL